MGQRYPEGSTHRDSTNLDFINAFLFSIVLELETFRESLYVQLLFSDKSLDLCALDTMPSHPSDLIPFEALPLDPRGPRGNAWGRFGSNDELGTLNLLTPEVIVEAAKEIQTGIRISLDWPLSMPRYPSFDRLPFRQELVLRTPRCIYDDILTFNTQGSTQWDGFRHYGEIFALIPPLPLI